MKKLLLVLLTVLFFIYFPDFRSEPYVEEKSVPEPAPVDVKVMSYDFSHVEKEGVIDVERMAEEIEASGADVIRVRKLESSSPCEFQNQTKMLAERLDMSYVHSIQLASQTSTGTYRGQNDTALLSNHPIIDAVNHVTSNNSNNEGLTEAIINVKGIQVHLFNAPQTMNAEDRTRQMNAATKLAANAEGPSIILGNLEQSDRGSEIELLMNTNVDTREMETYNYSLTDPENRMDFFFPDRNYRESVTSANLLLNAEIGMKNLE
ncbi:endonuclease/exonuclease/phosphatase family protein [Thalassobacillus devorans]|uniref:endonuclease/exonuclease/phosphatase family protein n=1 Tax=Thalassobacillus devorans TaxID=279813 RepID=UPI000491F2EB|nr:hypothetical protein [Thalassobacillus devorans]